MQNVKHIVVIIGGWGPGGRIGAQFCATVSEGLSGVRVWSPPLQLAIFSTADPEEVAQKLFQDIDAYLANQPSVGITFVGYSAGSLLARRVFCICHGYRTLDRSLGPKASWADRVHRMVVLAGITRGWVFSTAAPASIRFFSPLLYSAACFWAALAGLAKHPHRPRKPFIWTLQRGSPFVVATRIQYVSAIDTVRTKGAHPNASLDLTAAGIPSTVFLLGSRDEFISPADCSELGPRPEFVFGELPGSNHIEATQISGNGALDEVRRKRLLAALSLRFDDLAKEAWTIQSSDIDDYLDPMDLVDQKVGSKVNAADVSQVVMIVHGIRDSGFWTKRIAREIKTLARDLKIDVRAPSPTYGYFSMWDFIKPGGRSRATRWFMERYADVYCRFPSAEISFVGHSNGTYIAANAMRQCPAIKFGRIVFAGSVVRRDYQWLQCSQADKILNYVGSSDSVVAFLPAVFEKLKLRRLDVGGAGAFGFEQQGTSMHEIEFVDGGHGVAISEPFWLEIAAFSLQGTVPTRPTISRKESLKRLYTLAPIVTLFGALAAVALLAAPVLTVVILSRYLQTSIAGTAALACAVLVGTGVSWLVSKFLREW